MNLREILETLDFASGSRCHPGAWRAPRHGHTHDEPALPEDTKRNDPQNRAVSAAPPSRYFLDKRHITGSCGSVDLRVWVPEIVSPYATWEYSWITNVRADCRWPAPHQERVTMEISGASGSVNRWLRPDSVRHMSVTTAMQGLAAAHHETRQHNSKKARETGNPQLTGRFRRWWQVLGSNQRRLSRRFYRPPLLIWLYAS
jgi:hypothetical protein